MFNSIRRPVACAALTLYFLVISVDLVRAQNLPPEIQAIVDQIQAAIEAGKQAELDANAAIIRNQCLAINSMLDAMATHYATLPPVTYPAWSLPPTVDRGDGNGPTIIACPGAVVLPEG